MTLTTLSEVGVVVLCEVSILCRAVVGDGGLRIVEVHLMVSVSLEYFRTRGQFGVRL